MPAQHFREEVINVRLAEALVSRTLDATPEVVEGGRLPDVLVYLDGVRLVIEGRAAGRSASLFRDAQQRVVDAFADISMAISYPQTFYAAPDLDRLRELIESTRYDGALFWYGTPGIISERFGARTLDELVETINQALRLRIANDIVREQVRDLEATLESVARQASAESLFFGSEALVQRLQSALGITGSGKEEAIEAD